MIGEPEMRGGRLWACEYCRRIYRTKKDAAACESRCTLAKEIAKELRHAKAGEHTRKQALAIAYAKTRRAGYRVKRKGS